MILKNDTLSFTVQNKTVQEVFSTYTQALAFAQTLDFAFVNIKASNADNTSALCASVCKVRNGQIEMIHSIYAIDSVK